MHKKRSRVLAAALLAGALALATAAPTFAQGEKPAPPSDMPKVGEVAPDFTLKYFDGSDRKDVKLSDYRGKKNVVLAFFVFAFTGG